MSRALPLRAILTAMGFVAAGALGAASDPTPAAESIPRFTYEVVAQFPHDPRAFTQGLIFTDETFVESTGLHGESTLRKVDPATGATRQQITVPTAFFAEGMTRLGDRLFQITWQEKTAFVYDYATLQKRAEFEYEGEGWGLTTDGKSLIMSDGTNQLRFLDPTSFSVQRTIRVFFGDKPLRHLNELEYVKGEIYANIWPTNYAARIDPQTGALLGLIDFNGLLADADRKTDTDVLNGIAYDAERDRLYVTGKRWPKLFEVRLRSISP